MPNQLKRDPSRTTTLRKRFMVDMRRRFRKVEKLNTELIVRDDVFGLIPGQPFTTNIERQAWRFQTSAQKVKTYRKWLQQQIDAEILTPIGGISDKPWTAEYVESAYKKGVLRAYTDVHAEELAKSVDFFEGSKQQFLREAFGSPEALSKIELVSTRAFEELRGVTATMSQQLSRHLANGLAQGKGPAAIARDMRLSIGGLTRTRAMMIARTEIIAAHAEGQLDSYERLGVEEVGILAEWSTAGDDRVCALCDELEGAVMTIKEARGLIPRHPNCRCAWIPADKQRKEPGQLWGAKKDKAIRKSIQAEAPTGKRVKRTPAQVRRRSVWLGKERVRGIAVKKKAVRRKVIKKKEVVSKPKKLSVDETLALWDYTVSGYDELWLMREVQLGKAKILDRSKKVLVDWRVKEIKKKVAQIDKALSKLPNYEGTVYRGVRVERKELKSFLSRYKKGKTVRLKTFVSSSESKTIAKRFAKRKRVGEDKVPVLLQIESKTGKAVQTGGHQAGAVSEKEVMFRKGTKFKVKRVDKDVIYVEEI